MIMVLVSFPFQQPDGNVNVPLNNIALQIMIANGLLFQPDELLDPLLQQCKDLTPAWHLCDISFPATSDTHRDA